MNTATKSIAPILLALVGVSAHGQFYKLKGGSVSVGGTGQFTTPLTTNPSSGVFSISTPTGGVLNETLTNQQQYTTNSVGGLFSIQFHPVAFAGVEFNYGVTKYSERYAFNYSSASATQIVNVPTWQHEATAAYVFHPPHIPFQPFVNIGGGGIDFLPNFATNQWRLAGLLETGMDFPMGTPHLAFRVEGRALIYRAPNYQNAAISTRTWRSTEQPSASLVFKF